jgi:hypothetical protein
VTIAKVEKEEACTEGCVEEDSNKMTEFDESAHQSRFMEPYDRCISLIHNFKSLDHVCKSNHSFEVYD